MLLGYWILKRPVSNNNDFGDFLIITTCCRNLLKIQWLTLVEIMTGSLPNIILSERQWKKLNG